MTPPAVLASDQPQEIIYPESDGLPMADNSVQFRWIYTLYGNLAAWYANHPNVFVGGNQFWYPREGDPTEKQAPDVYVVFDRPKGDRPSYKQWEEDGVPMTVVFEVMSPSNDPLEMARRLTFYDEYGVEEYYIFDPLENTLEVYHRGQQALRYLGKVKQHTSRRLGIRFDLTGEEMRVYYPDGRPFLTFEELDAERQKLDQLRLEADTRAEQAQRAAEQAQRAAEQAQRDIEQANTRAEQADTRAEQAHRDVEQAKRDAEQAQRDAQEARTNAEKAQRDVALARTRAEQAQREIERVSTNAELTQRNAEQVMTMLQRFRELSRKARLQQATPEELLELDRLEEPDTPHS